MCSRIIAPEGQQTLDDPMQNNEEILRNTSIPLHDGGSGWLAGGVEFCNSENEEGTERSTQEFAAQYKIQYESFSYPQAMPCL